MRGHPSSQSTSSRFKTRVAGFSLTEMITTISILGILAGIVIMDLGGNYSTAKEILARDRLEMLNRGMADRASSVKEFIYTRSDSSVSDELFVLMEMQYRNPDPDRADLNSPYIDEHYAPTTSTSKDDYRLRWNGRRFELLKPGQIGSGLKVVFDGSDIGPPRVYPPNYNPSGR